MIERAISVTFPLHAKTLLTTKNVWICNACILAFLILYQIPWLIFYDIIPDHNDPELTMCHYPVKHEYWADFYIFGWGKALLECIIPLGVIFACVITIIVKLKTKSLTQNKSLSDDDKIKSITKMLLSVGIAFLLLMSLTIIDEIGFPLGLYDVMRIPDGTIFNEILMQLSFVLARVNNGINFMLYCATGSKFRKAFVEILCNRCRKGSRHEIVNSGQTASSAVSTGDNSV